MAEKRKGGLYRDIWRRYKKNKAAMIGLVIMIAIVLIAVCADWIVPYEKVISQSGAERLQPPSAAHWFGTDEYGRDLFARVIHGRAIRCLSVWRPA